MLVCRVDEPLKSGYVVDSVVYDWPLDTLIVSYRAFATKIKKKRNNFKK